MGTRTRSTYRSVANRMALLALLAGSTMSCLVGQKDREAQQSVRGLEAGMTGAGLEAFANSLYPFVRQNCASCHGRNQPPLFAAEDGVDAYPAAKSVAYFADPANSAFARKSEDAHCGSQCVGNSGTIIGLIQVWRAAEAAAGVPSGGGGGGGGGGTTPVAPGPNRTLPLPLPSNLPTGTTYTTVRWDLGQVTPSNPDLAGVIFELEVQRFTPGGGATPGSYRFRKPKLATAVNPIYVQGIRLLVNTKFDPLANDFADTDQAVAPQPIPAPPALLPFPVLSSGEMILLQDQVNDQIVVAFDNVRKTSAVSCRALTDFTTRARPVMANRCFGCHTNTASNANRKFNMTAPNDTELCARALQRTTQSNPLVSPIIVNPKNNANGHPVVNGLTTADMDNITAWVLAE